MGTQPHVDALDVKGMLTLGQAPPNLVLFKYAQANDAFQSNFALVIRHINEKRDCGNHRGIEAFGESWASRGSVVKWYGMKVVQPRLAEHLRDRDRAASLVTSLGEEPFGIDVEEEDEDGDKQQRD